MTYGDDNDSTKGWGRPGLRTMQLEALTSRILDPIMLVFTLGVFFSLWALVPKFGVFVSAIIASVISAVAFATVIEGMVPKLPSEADVLFARFISALVHCGIAGFVVRLWQRLRS